MLSSLQRIFAPQNSCKWSKFSQTT